MICIRWTRYEIILIKYIHIDLETHTCIYIERERETKSKIQIFSNISIYYVVYLECCHGRFCRMSFQTGKATSAISWQWQPTIYQRKATNVWCVPRVTGFHSHQQNVNQIIIFYVKSVQVANIRASLYTKNPSKLVSRVSFELHLFMHFKPLCRWTLTFQHPQIRRVSLRLLLPSLTFDFCWAPWVRATVANQFRNPAITSWYGRCPIICKVSYMSGGAGLLPSIVSRWMMNLRSTVSEFFIKNSHPIEM